MEIGGRTFCEGLLAATINEKVDDFFEQIGQDRPNKTREGADIPAYFLGDGRDSRPFSPKEVRFSEPKQGPLAEDRLLSFPVDWCGADANDGVDLDAAKSSPNTAKSWN